MVIDIDIVEVVSFNDTVLVVVGEVAGEIEDSASEELIE
jgi:hypothetical protein